MKGWEGQAGEYGVFWTLGREHSGGRKMANWSQWLQKGGHSKDQTQPNSLSLGALPAADLLVLSDLSLLPLYYPSPVPILSLGVLSLSLHFTILACHFSVLACPLTVPTCPLIVPVSLLSLLIPALFFPLSLTAPFPIFAYFLTVSSLSLPVPSLSLPSPAVLDLENRWLNLILGFPQGPPALPCSPAFLFFIFFDQEGRKTQCVTFLSLCTCQPQLHGLGMPCYPFRL